MALVRGFILAFFAFAASFALHIVGGATDQGWLFAAAVVLIYITAAGFPFFVSLFSREPIFTPGHRVALAAAAVPGLVFTSGALWAANGRAFAWWTLPAAVVLLAATTGALAALEMWSGRATRDGRRAPAL